MTTPLPTEVDTVVVGAGIAGIAAAAQLRRRGLTDVLVLERADDIGGTWRDNVYPGVACDIPSHLYAYSFHPNPHWSRRFASGAEIHAYLREVVDAEGLGPQIRFGTDVTAMTWHDDRERPDTTSADTARDSTTHRDTEHPDTGRWHLDTSRGPIRCRHLLLAVGRLSEPAIPTLPGLDAFPGTVLHSSTWNPDLDLRDTRVAVVGTGASAVQLVPHVAAAAARTTVFQRSAPYVVPRTDAPIPAEARDAFARHPESLPAHREALFAEFEAGHEARVSAGPARDALRARAAAHLATQVPNPHLRALLTPDHEIGCKRVLLSDDYYPTLATGSATLEPSALVALEGSTAVAASGARHEVDVLVFATGFHTTRPPFAALVRGRAGHTLAEHWSTGMTAYATMLVPGFPNLWILDGPNAALGHNSAFPMIEAQAKLAATHLTRMRAEHVPTLEASPEVEAAWTAELDEAAAGTVWLSGCTSWYVDPTSSRLTLLWPGTATAFRHRLHTLADAPLPTRTPTLA